MTSLLTALGILLVFSGCATPEVKHPLNVLNGENYEVGPLGPPAVIVVPLTSPKERESHIEGLIQVSNGLMTTPLRHIPVALFDRTGKQVLETTTDSDGMFRLAGIIVNGTYQIKIMSAKYKGAQSVTIKDYVTDGLIISAKE